MPVARKFWRVLPLVTGAGDLEAWDEDLRGWSWDDVLWIDIAC